MRDSIWILALVLAGVGSGVAVWAGPNLAVAVPAAVLAIAMGVVVGVSRVVGVPVAEPVRVEIPGNDLAGGPRESAHERAVGSGVRARTDGRTGTQITGPECTRPSGRRASATAPGPGPGVPRLRRETVG